MKKISMSESPSKDYLHGFNKAVDEMNAELSDLMYALDGWHDEYSARNFGNAEDWNRHVAKRYEEYLERQD